MPDEPPASPDATEPALPDSVRACGVDRIGALARRVTGLVLIFALAAVAQAQAPVQDAAGRGEAIQRGQQRAGAAYRDLQQARREASRAEQAFVDAQTAYEATQTQTDEAKRRFDAAVKARDTARAREQRARKVYDEALDRVDRARQAPPNK